MYNHIGVMGRLVSDPELKTTQSGTSVTSFRVAVERNYADKDGNRQADFFDVVAWRGTAEFVCRYFGKGRSSQAVCSLQVSAAITRLRIISQITTVSSSISRTAAISSIRRRFRLHNTDRATRLIMMRRR